MLLTRAQQKHKTKQTPTSPKDPPVGYKEKNLHCADGQTLECMLREMEGSVFLFSVQLVFSKGWN